MLNSIVRGSLAADAVDSVTIAATVRDAVGKPLENAAIRVEVSGSRNALTPAATMLTDPNGVAILNLTSTKAETKKITVIAGPEDVLLEDQPLVTFFAGTAVRFDVTESQVTNGARALTLTARDFFDNVVGTPTTIDLAAP